MEETLDEKEINYINNIGREIIRDCSSLGVVVTPELAQHLIKLKLLNPKNGFSVSQVMSRDITQSFVDSCVQALVHEAPAIDCVRLQAYWLAVNAKLDEVKEVYSSHIAEKTSAAFQDVLDVEDEEVDKMYKKIAAFSNTFTNIANANVAQNVKEAIHPLKSVFKHKDFHFFLTLTNLGKLEYLKFLARLVSGIRIYQHYFKKGSENVDNAPLLLPNLMESIKTEIRSWEDKVHNRLEMLIKELVFLYDLKPGAGKSPKPTGFTDVEVEEIKKIEIIMVQHLTYLSQLNVHLQTFEAMCTGLVEDFAHAATRLHEKIGDREAIPADEVYSDFMELCDKWSELQIENCYLICLGLIVKNLQMINKYFTLTKLEQALAPLQLEPKRLDEIAANRKIATSTESTQERIMVYKMTDDIELKFKGFCAWSLVKGLLIPARTELGVLLYHDEYYGFESADSADEWRLKLPYNLNLGYEVVRTNPELVYVLEMYEFLDGLKHEILLIDTSRHRIHQNRKIQTLTHPISKYLDKEYTFSVWELKRRALQLSRIVKCVTKSAQTVNHSNFRASIGLQCKPPETKETQTKEDRGCVHEAINNYLYGLRTTDPDKFQVLSLTRPVDESYKMILPTKETPCNERECPNPCTTLYPRECKKTMENSKRAILKSFLSSKINYKKMMADKSKLYDNDYY